MDVEVGLLLGLTFIVLLLTYLYLHSTRNFNYWKDQNVPYIKPTPFFGNIFPVISFKTMMGNFIEEVYSSTTEPFIGFFSFNQPSLLVRDPELIKHIFIKNFDSFSDRAMSDNMRDDKNGSNMLFVVKNPIWREARVKLTPIFTTGKLKNMTQHINNVATTFVEYLNEKIQENNEIYTREVSMKFSTDNITSSLFGLETNSFKYEDAQFRWASKRIAINSLWKGIQVVSYFFAPFLLKPFRMKFLEPEAAKFLKHALEETMSEREKNKLDRRDLIDLLLNVKKTQSAASAKLLDDDVLMSQALQLFAAGTETTGTGIFLLLHELSFNKFIQDRLRKEIIEGIDKQGGITYNSVQAMPYLNMVVFETLRKYPLMPHLDRRCMRDFQIPNSKLIIKKGLPIYISVLGLHLDPEYFPDPHKFDPERFNADNFNDVNQYIYMPFGRGLHMCLGERFALISIKVAIANLISKFEVEPLPDTQYHVKFNPKAFLIAPPTDFKIRFKKVIEVM